MPKSVNKKENVKTISNLKKFVWIIIVIVFFIVLYALPLAVNRYSYKSKKISFPNEKEEIMTYHEMKAKLYESSSINHSEFDDENIIIQYNMLPHGEISISDTYRLSDCKQDNNCYLINGTRYYKNGSLRTQLDCKAYKTPFLFLHILYDVFVFGDGIIPIMTYDCTRKEIYENGSIRLEAHYIDGEVFSGSVEERAMSDMTDNNVTVHNLCSHVMNSCKKYHSTLYYQEKKCIKGSDGYSSSNNNCKEEEYIPKKTGGYWYKSYYPSGILKNEQESQDNHDNTWTSKIFEENGKLKEKIIEKGNNRTEYYYLHGELRTVVKRNKKNKKYSVEAYSYSGDLNYEAEFDGKKLLKAYEYHGGEKQKMSIAKVQKIFHVDVEE